MMRPFKKLEKDVTVRRAKDGGRQARLAIPLEEATSEREVGGKAWNLARLISLGMPVPPGVVLTRAAFESFADHNRLTERLQRISRDLDPADSERFRRTADAIRAFVMSATIPSMVHQALLAIARDATLGPRRAVRSSAVGEDNARASFAGQFDSVLDVTGEAALQAAVLACWASCWSARALFYRAARRVPFVGMGVVVQRQVAARASGVLFTLAPAGLPGAAPDDLVVEYCAGRGDALVSGRVDPERRIVSRADLAIRRATLPIPPDNGKDPADLCSASDIVRLARLAIQVERELGGPQDIEWTIDEEGALWILQTRPITSGRDGDARLSPSVLWSNANVNENFPRPISPLLYSIASAGYYHYFRNLGLAFGISRRRLRAMDRALGGIIGVHGARMFYNLTNIHSVLRMAPFGEQLAAAFNRFVGADRLAAQPPGAASWDSRRRGIRQAAESIRIAVQTAWQYLFLRRRVELFEETADRFALRTRPECLEDRPLAALVLDLSEFLDIRCNRWKNASLADAASMVCYALLQRALAGIEDGATLHNQLLRALPGVPSAVPPLRLWTLSRAIRSDEALREVFSRDATDALHAIRHDERFTAFCRSFDRFLDEWGFRSSAELMLTEPSLREHPLPVIELLKSYAAMDGEPPAEAIARQAKERTAATSRLLRTLARRSPLNAASVWLLLRSTQRAVVYRERVRLKQALLYNRCRAIALAIGKEFGRRSVFAAPDDVFMLTFQEITDLASGRSMFPYHVADLIALRRREHQELSAMHPPETFCLREGFYLPPDSTAEAVRPCGIESTAGAEAAFTGTSACGGIVTARAAVLTDVGEANRLQRGEVLVTRQTDPGWAAVFGVISGLVIERGGMLSHGAIIAREFGLPCVVGIRDVTRRIAHGALVTVDGDRGTCTIVAPPEGLRGLDPGNRLS